jgi:hypothetical protein
LKNSNLKEKEQALLQTDKKERPFLNAEQIQEEDDISVIWSKSEEGIRAMKTKKQYALDQKIPASVKLFSLQEMISKQFSARHSSMLRILTKWAEYLEQIFKGPEQYVRRRIYPFRTIENDLVSLS